MMMNEWINFLFFPFNFLCRYCFVVAVYDVFGVYDVVYDVVLCKFRTYVCCVWCCVWYCLCRCLLYMLHNTMHNTMHILRNWFKHIVHDQFNYWFAAYSTSITELIQTTTITDQFNSFAPHEEWRMIKNIYLLHTPHNSDLLHLQNIAAHTKHLNNTLLHILNFSRNWFKHIVHDQFNYCFDYI